MMVIPTYVAASPIAGVGLFAAEPVIAGTLIWTSQFDRTFSGRELNEMPALLCAFVEKYGYKLDDGAWACGLDNSRFMNHSDQPSAMPSGDCSHCYVAARDLAAGDEITCDYRFLNRHSVPGQRLW